MDNLNRIAQTSESSAQLAVRKPPSLDYVEWLVVSITNLAIYLRDTSALDAEGMVVQKMAEDLAHTGQFEMVDVFMLARRRFKFLPRTVELLDLYAEVRKSYANEEERMRNKAALDEQAAQAEDRRLHPERHFTVGNALLDVKTPAIQEHIATLEKRDFAAKAQQAAQDNAPKIEECSHCGKPIPMRVADLRGLSIEHLESLIEGKKLYAAQHNANLAAAHESLLLAIAAAREQDAAMIAKGEAARARLAGEPPPPTPKKTRTKKGAR